MILFSNAERSFERNYANSWRNDQLEAAVVVLMKQMINRSAKSNMSIVEDARDQDANPFKAATIIFPSDTKTIYFQFLR